MSDRPEDLQRDLETIVRFEYDVFIIFATEDESLARHVCEGLEKLSLRCIAQFKPEGFQFGQNVVDNIVHNVTKAHKTLLLFTEKSLKSQWVTLETILALEESQRCNNLRLRMLACNVSDREIISKRGILASVPRIRIDFNKNDWNQQLLQEMSREIPLPEVLPVGSMAHGLVFSHYTGFLCHVLPVLKQAIKTSCIYQQKPCQVSMKYYMLIPSTCKICDDLTSEDPELNIKIKKGEFVVFNQPHAGKDRTINLTIYKISKDNEEFYFFADFPHVLKAMFRMQDEQLAEVDMKFQIARFYYTMNEMINHVESKVCPNTIKLCLFDDNEESMQSKLWGAVSSSVPTEVQENMPQDFEIMEVQPANESSDSMPETDATITCCNDCVEDRDIAVDMQEFLEKRGKRVKTSTEANTEGLLQFQLPEAKWHIFVLSKEAITTSEILTTQCLGAMAMNFRDDALHILVVIRDLDPTHVPRFIKCVSMLKVTEPNYREKLLKTMNGDALRLEHSLPAGDVATGLAWAYVINYLSITLLGTSSEDTGCLDFKGRIQKFLRESNVLCGCIKKMFIVIPKSCTTAPNLADKANEKQDLVEVKQGTGRVTKLGSIQPVIMNTGGQLNRPFFLQMYRHDDPVSQTSICFIAEYCTPTNCMREMVENYKFAGLSEEEMDKQCGDFVDLLPNIMQSEAVKKGLGDISQLVELVYYNDKSETLLSAIESHIQPAGHEIVYTEDKPRTADPNFILPR